MKIPEQLKQTLRVLEQERDRSKGWQREEQQWTLDTVMLLSNVDMSTHQLREIGQRVESRLQRDMASTQASSKSMEFLLAADAAIVAAMYVGVPTNDGAEERESLIRVALMRYQLLQWVQYATPLFDLSSDFFYAIGATEFGEATSEQLALPFPAFLLTYPKSYLLEAREQLEGLGLTDSTGSVWQSSMMFVGQMPDGNVQISLLGSPFMFVFEQNATRASVLAQLERTAAEMTHISDVVLREAKAIVPKAMLLLANTLTYIESAGLPKEPAKRGEPPAPVERLSKNAERFAVGRPVKLDGMTRQALMTPTGAPLAKLAHRHVVRGHWRNQVYGEGRALRKRVWIEPFWRGPEDAVEALQRQYKVV